MKVIDFAEALKRRQTRVIPPPSPVSETDRLGGPPYPEAYENFVEGVARWVSYCSKLGRTELELILARRRDMHPGFRRAGVFVLKRRQAGTTFVTAPAPEGVRVDAVAARQVIDTVTISESES